MRCLHALGSAPEHILSRSRMEESRFYSSIDNHVVLTHNQHEPALTCCCGHGSRFLTVRTAITKYTPTKRSQAAQGVLEYCTERYTVNIVTSSFPSIFLPRFFPSYVGRSNLGSTPQHKSHDHTQPLNLELHKWTGMVSQIVTKQGRFHMTNSY